MFDGANNLKNTVYVAPEDFVRRGSDGEYFYSVTYSNSNSGNTLYSKFTLIKSTYITIWTGGFPEDRFYSIKVASANSNSRPRCTNGGGDGTGSGSKANLTASKIVLKNDGEEYNVFPNGDAVDLVENTDVDFEFTFENKGGLNASKSEYILYLSQTSSDSQIPDDAFAFRTSNGGSINSNSSKNITFTRFLPSFIGNVNFTNNTKYYFYLEIDYDDDIDESNENDNLFRIDFTFKEDNDTTGIFPGGPVPIDGGDFGFQSRARIPSEPYNLEIYDLTGRNVLTKKVFSKNQENAILGELPKKIYILKSKNGTRKVY